MSINKLLVVVVFSYTLSKKFFHKNKQHLTSVLYAMSEYFICLPWNFTTTIDGNKVAVSGMLNSNFIGQQGMFSGLLISGCTVFIYNKLLKKI